MNPWQPPFGLAPNGVELASDKVAKLVKSFEQVNEFLDGFRYKMGAYPLKLPNFIGLISANEHAATC